MKKLFTTWLLTLTALLLCLDASAQTGKPVLQQTDASQADTYLTNRRALVGRHCVVNKLISVVSVGQWTNDLNNLTDDDLDNVATIPQVVTAGVTVNPIVSIRDMQHHYAAGTTAGFTIVAGSGSSLLDLDIIKAYSLVFYCEGELVGTAAVKTGQEAGGVGLSLITIPGSDDVCFDMSAAAPAEFDEVMLQPAGGVNVSAVTSIKIKYAFVGDYVKHTITETSMKEYAAAHGRKSFVLDQGYKSVVDYPGLKTDLAFFKENGSWPGSDLINDDLTDGVAWGVLAVGTTMDARVGAAPAFDDPDQSQPFKAGTQVVFVYDAVSLLNLPVGSGITVKLYKGGWEKNQYLSTSKYYWRYEQEEVQSELVSANVLSLNVASGSKQEVTITAKEDFSHARIIFPTGLTLDLGGKKVYYAYVCDPPEVDHECNIRLTAPTAICDTENSFQVENSGEVEVTWEIVSQPGSATIDATGLITGMNASGDYVVKATSKEDGTCYQTTTITRGIEGLEDACDRPIYNTGTAPTYVLSNTTYGESGALLSVNAALSDPENILNGQLDDYATFTGGVRLVENDAIVGVRKTTGTFSDGVNKHRIGFVVETRSTGLGLNLLDMFNIRTFNNGARTYSHAVNENNVLSVNLIGSSKSQKIRFSIAVPADVEFNEFQLYLSGTLNVDISRMNIYYAFDEPMGATESDDASACADPLGCSGLLVSNTATGATINGNETNDIGVISVAKVTDNLSYLIDDDINSAVMVANTVSAGGTKFAIDLGRVFTPNQQVGIVMDNAAYLAGVGVGGWLKLETYLNGELCDTQTDWSVAGVNVIGYGDKSFLFMSPTKDYDEIRITIAGVLKALDFTKLYGVFVRNDADGDGIPDCRDDYSCSDELVLDEEATELNKDHDYAAAHLVLHRTLNKGEWHPIVLPVNLTGLQLRNAFGNHVKIATPAELIVGSVNTINFKSIELDESVLFNRGEFYLINAARDPDLVAGEYYDSKNDGRVSGPIYFIEGVDYVKAESEQPIADKLITERRNAPAHGGFMAAGEGQQVNVKGSYVYLDGSVNEKVPAKNYLYTEDGSLWVIDEASPMLGFRYYIEDLTTNGKDISYTVDGIVTGITQIAADRLNDELDHHVYTIDGRSIGIVDDLTQLPAGIYVIKGKKIKVN